MKRASLDADLEDSDTTWTVDQYNSSVYKIGDATNPGHTDVRRVSPFSVVVQSLTYI